MNYSAVLSLPSFSVVGVTQFIMSCLTFNHPPITNKNFLQGNGLTVSERRELFANLIQLCPELTKSHLYHTYSTYCQEKTNCLPFLFPSISIFFTVNIDAFFSTTKGNVFKYFILLLIYLLIGYVYLFHILMLQKKI